jgi:hypothetical protein
MIEEMAYNDDVRNYMRLMGITHQEYESLSDNDKLYLKNQIKVSRMGTNFINKRTKSGRTGQFFRNLKQYIPGTTSYNNASLKNKLTKMSITIPQMNQYIKEGNINFPTFKAAILRNNNNTKKKLRIWVDKYKNNTNDPIAAFVDQPETPTTPQIKHAHEYLKDKQPDKVKAYAAMLAINKTVFPPAFRDCKTERSTTDDTDEFRKCVLTKMRLRGAPVLINFPAAGGRTRKRTQKRARRNRRTTARFFVRGK